MSEKVIAFMSKRYIAAAFSLILLVASIGSLVTQGLNFGLDFTGGTLIELKYEDAADLSAIRTTLDEEGFEGAIVINYGSVDDVLIRLQQTESKHTEAAPTEEKEVQEGQPKEKLSVGEVVVNLLKSKTTEEIELKRIEVVGPQIGDELRDEGGLGMLFALMVVMAYVAIRFQFKFSVGAVAALIHDVIIVLGLFSLLQLNFDLTVLAAVLAVIGYSLNDTIVVSDRIRENFRVMRKADAIEVIDTSLTQTLGRTMITSLTTLMVLLALYFVGGEMIHNFAAALIIGIAIGTYSSIYVAANILILMNISKEDLIPPKVEVEGADQESLLP